MGYQRGYLLFLLISLLFVHPLALAKTPYAETIKLSSIKKNITKLNKAQKKSTIQKKNSIDTLKKIDLDISKTLKELSNTQALIREKKIHIHVLQEALLPLSLQLKNDQKALNNYILLSKKLNNSQPIILLLNKKDPSLTHRLMIYITYINKKQTLLLSKTLLLKKDILNKKTDSENNLIILKAMIEEHKQILITYQDTKRLQKETIQAITSNIEDRANKIEQLNRNKNKLNLILKKIALVQQRKMDNIPFTKLKYKLPWPIEKNRRKSTGKFDSELRSNGIYIKTSEGRQVSAVRSGKVVFSDWLRGYGLLIILRHDLGFMTLYANNQVIYKEKGDSVYTGEKIATVGRSGGQLQNGLYFEIRKNGKPLPPLSWLSPISPLS